MQLDAIEQAHISMVVGLYAKGEVGLYVPQVWSWEYLPITSPICDDMRHP